jgi:DNA invertase Pin-like site-specific DNA recombinase
MENSSHPNNADSSRAVGIVRVSETKGRDGERFASPAEQRQRIKTACERDGISLVDVYEELDVSGGKPLDQRPGLSRAVEAIERGEADVIAAAYFDRLFRSLTTQAEVVDRVEAAGGQVLAVDVGQVTNGTAGQWLSGTMLGAVSEYMRRSIKERTAGAQARAVARGATPWARVPAGYVRRDDGTLAVDRDLVPLVQHAFEMRIEGASIMTIRRFLAEHGIERSPRGVQVMLESRVYLGEIHFGEHVNLHAHEPIIDHDVWERVQRIRVPRGPQASSDRLLARLGVLRCGSCGARMAAMKLPRQKDYPIYRCPSTSDCPRHMTIAAEIAERVVTEKVRAALADVEGRASAAESARAATRSLEGAQAELDSAVRSFTAAGLLDESAAIERLAELRQARDDAQARVDRMGGESAAVTINVADDWDRLSREAQRAMIRATIERATVHPGRGADRIEIQFVGS